MISQIKTMVEFENVNAEVFDYGNSIRNEDRLSSDDCAFDFPVFVPVCDPIAVLRKRRIRSAPRRCRVVLEGYLRY